VGRSGLTMEPCRSRPRGDGAVPIFAWRRGSRPGGGGAMLISAWRRGSRPGGGGPVLEIHFDWVFAEAHQLEDLFMEPWVEATCGGRGENWVCSSRFGFFFFLIL
jgi:hypothetical protein